MKVAVCIAHAGLIRGRCAQALNEVVAHTLSVTVSYNGAIVRPEFAFLYEDAGPLDYKRNKLARRALDCGADYHLLVDWDHVFPPDALLRLAQHDLPVVGANYPMRHDIREPAALRDESQRASGRGVERVAAIGLGFCLVKRDVFTRVSAPWFVNRFDEEGNFVCGEDVEFCNKVRAAGLPVFVDHDLRVGHIAETLLTLEG